GGAIDTNPVSADVSDEGQCGEGTEGAESERSEWALCDAPLVEEVVLLPEQPIERAGEDRDPGSEQDPEEGDAAEDGESDIADGHSEGAFDIGMLPPQFDGCGNDEQVAEQESG